MREETRELRVGDWVASHRWSPKSTRRISAIDGGNVWFDLFDLTGSGTSPVNNTQDGSEGEPWPIGLALLNLHRIEHTPIDDSEDEPERVGEESKKPRADTLDVKLFSVHRSAPSKGYEVALFPGAPFGSEVILSLREREEIEVEAIVETPAEKPAFLSLVVGAVTVLMDLDTAEAVANAFYWHSLGTGEVVESEGDVQ